MEFLSSSKISKKRAKEGFEYPIIRLPKELSSIIGKIADIYRVDENKFLVVIKDIPKLDNKLYNHATISKDKRKQDITPTNEISNTSSPFPYKNKNKYLWCGGWDLNPGTPTGRGLKPRAVDQAWLPPHRGIIAEKAILFLWTR